jgi:hypothetical protein
MEFPPSDRRSRHRVSIRPAMIDLGLVGIFDGRLVAETVADEVHGEDVEMLGQRRDVVLPVVLAAGARAAAVNQHHGIPGPRLHEMRLDAVTADEPGTESCHGPLQM